MAKAPKRPGEFFELLRSCIRKAIIRYRSEYNGTLKDLVAEAGMDRKTLGRLEDGGSLFRVNYMLGLFRAFGISLDDFLRRMADCYLEEQKEMGPTLQEYSFEELLRKELRIRDARARADRELVEIEQEFRRRGHFQGRDV